MLNYLEQKNYFWRVYDAHSLGQAEIALYFHLLEICDKCNWVNPFKRQNTKICAQLNMSKKTLEKTRNKLQQVGLIAIDGMGKGSTNIRYEIKKATIYPSKYSSIDPTLDTSDGNINKDYKRDFKITIVEYAQAIDFFLKTKNFGLLGEKYFGGARETVESHFKVFYDDKVDLGEFNNKTSADLVRHFSRWLPIYLQVTSDSSKKGNQQDKVGESKTDAALRRHNDLLKEFEKNGK